MKNVIISYDSIWEFEDSYFAIDFPDCPGCLTCASTQGEGMMMAKEALMLWLDGMKYDELPNRTDVKCGFNQKVVTIEVTMQLEDGELMDTKGRQDTMRRMDAFCQKKLSEEQYSKYSSIKEIKDYEEFSMAFFKMLDEFALSEDFSDFMQHNMVKSEVDGLILFNNYEQAREALLRVNEEEQAAILEELSYKYESMMIYGFILYMLSKKEELYLHNIAILILQTSLCHIEGAYELSLLHMRRTSQLDENSGYDKDLLLLYDFVFFDYKEALKRVNELSLEEEYDRLSEIRDEMAQVVNDIEIIECLIINFEDNIEKLKELSGIESIIYLKEYDILFILEQYRKSYDKEYNKLLLCIVKGAFTEKVVEYMVTNDICIDVLIKKKLELSMLLKVVNKNEKMQEEVLYRLYEDKYREEQFFQYFIKYYSDSIFMKLVNDGCVDLNRKNKMCMITERLTNSEKVKNMINESYMIEKLMYTNDVRLIEDAYNNNKNNNQYNRAIASNINTPRYILDKLKKIEEDCICMVASETYELQQMLKCKK